MSSDHSDGILAGLRVLDLSVALAGPFCTLNLAGMGAEVIKVEGPGGHDLGRWNSPFMGSRGLHLGPPVDDDMSVSMMDRSRNKKSITLELKTERGRELFLELATKADVVVENLSDGTIDRLGVGYEAVSKVNPRIIYCSISGFGQDSPYPGLKSMDVIAQAMSGLMEVTGFPDGPPVRVGVPIGDLAAPLYATSGILAALWYRERTGQGQHLDISLLDCIAALVAEEHFDALDRFGFGSRAGNFLNRLAPFGVYPASDGHVAISGAIDDWAKGLFEAMGLADLLNDPRFSGRSARAANADEVNQLVENWTRTLTREEIVERLYRQQGVPAAAVRGPQEMLQDPHLEARGAIVALPHPSLPDVERVMGSGLPIHFSRGEAGFTRPAPWLGEHNDEVLGSLLGLSADEIDGLRHDGVV